VLVDRWSGRLKIVNKQRRTDYLRRRFGSCGRRGETETEGGRGLEDERKRKLEVAEKEYAQQKKLKKARQGKKKAMESEDSGEEMEKELQGSNKKIS
jgi:hypothetical protein